MTLFSELTSLPLVLYTNSPEETEAVGACLAGLFGSDRTLPPFVALYGNLGVGKTAFVRGFASVLAPGRLVRSPTFALVNEYRVPGRTPLFHFDMYRVTSDDELYSMGYDDYLDRGICLSEWCENIPDALPARRVQVMIEKCPGGNDMNADKRKITLCLKEDPLC